MRRSRLGGLLAVGGASALLLVLGSATWLRARADERMLDAGAVLLGYARAVSIEGPNVLALNGASFGLLAASSEDPIAEVFDVFDARCAAHGADFSSMLDRFPRLRRVLPPTTRSAFRGVLRLDGERAGYLACLELDPAGLGLREWAERLRAFEASSDFAELGGLRFVWAQRSQAHTRYVALWNRGRLPLASMFPAAGDAPGVDAAGMPRPAGRRVLSAYQPGAAPLIVAYRTPGEPALALARYRKQLVAQGFVVEPSQGTSGSQPPLVVSRGAALATVSAVAAAGAETVIAITPLR